MDTARQQFRAAFAARRAAHRDFVEIGPQTHRAHRLLSDYVNLPLPMYLAVREAFSARLDPLLYYPATRLYFRRLGRPVRL